MSIESMAQTIYMQFLVKKAKAQAYGQLDKLAFDPQGRVLVDVELSPKDIESIVREINGKIGFNHLGFRQGVDALKGLEDALGHTITPSTTVSLDITTDLSKGTAKSLKVKELNEEGIEEEASEQITKILSEKFAKTIKEKLSSQWVKEETIEKYRSLPKGSIIALQQEFHFHLALASRVYQKSSKALNETEMQEAHHAAMLEVNELVMAHLAKGLKSSLDEQGDIDIPQLNQALDKARKEIAPQAHSIFLKKIAEHTGVTFSGGLGDSDALKKKAEETTATPNDLLHTERDGLAVLIAGSEETAHKRKPGEKLADKRIITHVMGEHDTVVVNKNHRIQIRTPSPAVKKKKDLNEDSTFISDVAEKLSYVTNKYKLEATLTRDKVRPKAFIYNSYTAIEDTLDDLTTQNRQTESASHILRGAHEYNRQQLKAADKGPVQPVFCFVQNISVNGFGDHLAYNDRNNSLVKESTLMAEMAMLHTLADAKPVKLVNGMPQQVEYTRDQQEQLVEIFQCYKNYLLNSNSPEFFSDSDQGKEAISKIEVLKQQWQKERNFISPNDEVDSGNKKQDEQNFDFPRNSVLAAKFSLKNMMASNLHMKHKYAKLIQSLSVFVEEASIGGCKSGNERAQAINGRVAIFDRILNTKREELDPDEQAVCDYLAKLAQCTGNVESNAKKLKDSVDKLYNKKGLQSSMSLISLADQGASAKVEAKPIKGVYVSRNFAEESAAIMSNLWQKNSSKMQAHKSLTKMMISAWEGRPQTWWSRMKSSKLGVFGAIIGTISFVPAVAIAIIGYRDNENRRAKASNERTQLSIDYSQRKQKHALMKLSEQGQVDIVQALYAGEKHISTTKAKEVPVTDQQKLVTSEQVKNHKEGEEVYGDEPSYSAKPMNQS